ncbi:MAG: Rid family detoxifying hydrolase [Flavobacteriaceae bacterium]|nr:Rid family detoxifying hydrolase [Flavobacteriaceae bacterium]
MKKTILQTPNAPAPIGPYSQAVLIEHHGMKTLYTSGQIAINPKTGALITDDIEQETHQVMQNLQAVLKSAKMDFTNAIKTGIFLSDMELFPKVNKVYATYFEEDIAPARETVEVANLPKYVNVEISIIAVSEA